MRRVRLGRIYAHTLTCTEALDEVARLVVDRRGVYMVTPNVDHVVQAEHNDELQAAYDGASLSLVDGQPLVWLSRLMREPLPEKISGSDFVPRLLRVAARRGWHVFFLVAAEGVGARAAEFLKREDPGLKVTVHCPSFGFERDREEHDAVLQMVRDTKPDLLVLALGCPKQEILMHCWNDEIAPTVAIGAGATLDFIAGSVSRAPAWVSDAGLEWLYRLAREPRRLAYRYPVRDPEIIKVAWQMLRLPRAARVLEERRRSS